MKINVSRDVLLDKVSLASRFTSNKLSSSTVLQGLLIKSDAEGKLHIYSTNLNAYFHTVIDSKVTENIELVIEPKKIIEFLQFLPPGEIGVDIKEKQITISQDKTKGNFPLMVSEEFPMPPELAEKPEKIDAAFLQKNLPLILFTASQDETRPVLTGVNFANIDEDLLMVSTDGFRLSIMKEKKKGTFPSMIVPADFLQEVMRNMKDVKDVLFSFSRVEKIVRFTLGEDEYFSRLIDGEFPPFERVIPAETKTKAIVDKAELLRNIKLISVFARDYSNVIVCEFKKEGLYIRPKKDMSEENKAFQEIELEGEEQKVAFNFKFIVDLLNHIDSKEVIVEMLRSDAPVLFKLKENPAFLHIIMPVRIQE
ncbi:MAG: hypothetical protein RI947_700 [Candidatus Parcubacteria bacterium]|jgi:DNA polymerase-3 subunit beta